jgi:hypothetical protein
MENYWKTTISEKKAAISGRAHRKLFCEAAKILALLGDTYKCFVFLFLHRYVSNS